MGPFGLPLRSHSGCERIHRNLGWGKPRNIPTIPPLGATDPKAEPQKRCNVTSSLRILHQILGCRLLGSRRGLSREAD